METPICPWQHQRNGAAQMSWTKPSSKMWSAVDSGKVCFFLGEKPGGFQGLKPNQPTTTGKPIIAVFLEMFKLHSGWYVFCHKKDGDLPYKSLSINLQMRFWKQNTQKKTGNSSSQIPDLWTGFFCCIKFMANVHQADSFKGCINSRN